MTHPGSEKQVGPDYDPIDIGKLFMKIHPLLSKNLGETKGNGNRFSVNNF
jgi:hypothetical protein